MRALAGVEPDTLPGYRTSCRPTNASKDSAKADLAAIHQTLTHVNFYVYIQVLLSNPREALKGVPDVNLKVLLDPPPSEYGQLRPSPYVYWDVWHAWAACTLNLYVHLHLLVINAILLAV